MKKYGIPLLRSFIEGNYPGNYVSSQPIIQLKELEVDQERYNEWKMSLEKAKKRARKKP